MARFRLADPAKADIAAILRTSGERHGSAGRTRYRALLSAALRRIAAEPEGRSTRDRADLLPGIRSFHLRHVRGAAVADPAHVIFYRAVEPGLVEVVRVLHERMEPSRHVNVPHAGPES